MGYDDSKYEKERVLALIDWAKSTSFPKELQLSRFEQVKDVPRMVKADLKDIEKHYTYGTFHPAVERLYRLKEALQQTPEQ